MTRFVDLPGLVWCVVRIDCCCCWWGCGNWAVTNYFVVLL